MKMNCDQIKQLLEAYALRALEPDEQKSVEQHLAECPDCQQLALEFEHTASLLPEALAAASSLRPPDSLKERLLQHVQAEKASASTTESNPASSQEHKPSNVNNPSPAPSTNDQTNKVQPRPTATSGQWGWLRSGVVAVVALTVLLILAVILGAQLSIAMAEGRALQAELANLFDQQELVLEVVDSSHTVKRVLLAPEPREDSELPSYGKLYTRTDMPHVVAMVARLPDPPEDQAYHLWLTDAEGRTKLAGTMSVNEQGFGLLVFDAERDDPIYESAQLTLQPIGSTTPANDSILVWQADQE